MRFFEYLASKLAYVFLTILVACVAAFFVFRLLPGDPTLSMLDPRLDPEARREILRTFGLDRPLPEQFALYLVNLLRGELGYSFSYIGTKVTELVLGPRLFNTVVLMSLSIAISAVVGTVLGLVAGWRAGTALDRLLTGFLYLLFSLPVFWIALVIQFYLGYVLGVLPISGTTSYHGTEVDPWLYLLDYLRHLAAPMLTVSIFLIPGYYIYIRNTVAALGNEDFVFALKAYGLPEWRILRNILRHVLIHTVSITANYSPLLVTGAVFTETVFGWNGIGRLLYESILKSDYPVLQGVFLLTITVVVVANLVADIAYYFIDPRIKRGVGL
ncbi:MAG: ABC transporter permease [Desulfurococcaceae archaeon]|jgi:peptide/nickel transport system permease protein|nr:ABC transporter permease [Desulfurococcaceae archaeon]